MKRSLLLIIAVLVYSTTFAQQEKSNFKLMSTKFVDLFNTNKNDSIVEMFSSEMAAALPLDKFTKVTTGLKTQLGNIKNIRFVRLQNTTALYETTFELIIPKYSKLSKLPFQFSKSTFF
jgi:hypothetical protein